MPSNFINSDFEDEYGKYFGPSPLDVLMTPTAPGDVPSIQRKNIADYATKVISELYTKGVPTNTKNQILIVGITGYAGTGKDAAIAALESLRGAAIANKYVPGLTVKLNSVRRIAFADPLKKIARMFGFSKEQLVDRSLKEATDEFWGISPRKFLQMVGTEMFRNVWRQDAWTKCFEREFKQLVACSALSECEHGLLDVIIVPDVRFHNEVECIKELGGIVVRIERPNNPNAIAHTHASEKDVPNLKVDGVITNDANSPKEWSLNFWHDVARTLSLVVNVKHVITK